jgi:flavin reductase (DIM6/NTAB) family NADH-FMN oxidoreductase RutF
MYSWAPIAGKTLQTLDAQRFRKALGSFPTGICLVTTIAEDGKSEGMTINSFASVSLAPALILWSIRDDARSIDAFLTSRAFILSVLAADQAELAMHFAKPAPDKFSRYEGAFEPGIDGCPRLKRSVATYECTVYSRHQEGDHTILLGQVQEFSGSDHAPLMFHAGKMGSMKELAAANDA